MKKLTKLIITNLCFLSSIAACGNGVPGHSFEKQEFGNDLPNDTKVEIRTFTYNSLTIPSFFTTIITNHLNDFYKIDSVAYHEFCGSENLIPKDTNNIRNYFTLKILHDLFTCSSASNCSRGKILDVPYFWHWVSPNPRHEIHFTATGKLLNGTKPPQEFSKYGSFADIDRTPYLFLSDLLAENPRYYSVSCDTFSTFGWCSEREMAFSALTKLLNYDSKVVASGNHSWSETILKMKAENGTVKSYKVHIDNTFDDINFSAINQNEIVAWKQNLGNSDIEKWYNRKTESDASKINKHTANKKAMQRIEKKIVKYLEYTIQAIYN